MPVYLLAEAGFGPTPAEPRCGHDRLECAETSRSRIDERGPRFDPKLLYAASETSAVGYLTPTLRAARGGSNYRAQACDWHGTL
jgi:hypothetical protein